MGATTAPLVLHRAYCELEVIVKERKPSSTAESAALIRAMESMKPEHERVCYDPLARILVRNRFKILGRISPLAKIVYWYLAERRFPAATSETILRTRYIDDYLNECIRSGIEQLVILGAGFDSRAYRFNELKGKAKVFEVDHPTTQRVKIERLKKVFASLPDHVVYVPIDFNKEKLDKRLFECGYDRNLKTLFIWETVTLYLTAEAVDETLAFVANNSGEGSSIYFDYIPQSVLDGTSELKEARKIRELFAKMGEPLTFAIEEGTIDEFLSNRGFYKVESIKAEDLRNRYLKGKNQGRKVGAWLGMVRATVKPKV
jgi:methyltransferase (TIGR00027 family)